MITFKTNRVDTNHYELTVTDNFITTMVDDLRTRDEIIEQIEHLVQTCIDIMPERCEYIEDTLKKALNNI